MRSLDRAVALFRAGRLPAPTAAPVADATARDEQAERERRMGARIYAALGALPGRSMTILEAAVAEYREKKMVFAAHVVGAAVDVLREEGPR